MDAGPQGDAGPQRRGSALLQHVAIALALAAAVAWRWWGLPGLDDRLPYITLYPVLILAVLRQGPVPGLLWSAAGLLAVEFVAPRVVPDLALWRSGAPVRWFTFSIILGVVLLAGGYYRRVRDRLGAAQRRALELARGEARSAEAAAAASGHLAAIVQHASDAMIACTPDGAITAWNPAAERIFGHAAREVIGQHVSLLVPPQERERQAATMVRVQAGETVVEDVVRLHRAGHLVTVRLSVSPMRGGDGQVLGMCAVAQDIGLRKRTEEALRQSEATLRAFYENSPVCMGVVEPTGDGDILHIYDNRVTCELFGVQQGSTAYRLSSTLGSTDATRALWLKHYAQSLATGKPAQFEYTIGSGTDLRWLTATVASIGKGPSGRTRFCYVSEDVTDRHRAALRLAESEARARLALEVAGLGTWSWERPTDVIEADARCREMSGMPAKGILRLSDAAARIHPEDWPRVQQALEAAFEADSSGAYRQEFRLVHPDGQVRWLLSRGQVMQGHGVVGVSTGTLIIGTVLDVTERREVEQRLLEADRRKDEFLAVLAHELRNPMAPLVTGVEILRRVGGSAEHRDKAVAMMERQTRHLVRLVNDLLDLSRITQGRLDLQRAPLSLAAVLDSALETARPRLEAAGHALTVKPPPAELQVDGDLTRLSQVFSNLLNNAAKYTPPGGRIEVDAEREGAWAVVSVRDNGVGIEGHMLARVFDMFAQVDVHAQGAREGLGIGLGIARRLVEMHGGSIEARSGGAGQGSTFVVRLPVSSMAEPPAVVAAPKSPACKVLVVDDNVDAAAALAELLALAGHETLVAHGGEAALAQAAEHRPDLALVDLEMPGLGGQETARLMRERMGAECPALVALTGWGQAEDRARSLRAGFDAHLVKPVTLRDVDEACVNALARRAAAVAG